MYAITRICTHKWQLLLCSWSVAQLVQNPTKKHKIIVAMGGYEKELQKEKERDREGEREGERGREGGLGEGEREIDEWANSSV